MFVSAFLERIGHFIHRRGAEDAELTQMGDRTASDSERVCATKPYRFCGDAPARYRSRFCSNERPLRLRGEEKPRHAQVGIKATGITIALLLSTVLLCTARAQTGNAPAQTTQQPAAQQTPTQTPTPTPTPAPTPADGEAVEHIESDAPNVLVTAEDTKGRC